MMPAVLSARKAPFFSIVRNPLADTFIITVFFNSGI